MKKLKILLSAAILAIVASAYAAVVSIGTNATIGGNTTLGGNPQSATYSPTAAATETFHAPAFFETNVFLFDNPSVPLHLRLDAGNTNNQAVRSLNGLNGLVNLVGDGIVTISTDQSNNAIIIGGDGGSMTNYVQKAETNAIIAEAVSLSSNSFISMWPTWYQFGTNYVPYESITNTAGIFRFRIFSSKTYFQMMEDISIIARGAWSSFTQRAPSLYLESENGDVAVSAGHDASVSAGRIISISSTGEVSIATSNFILNGAGITNWSDIAESASDFFVAKTNGPIVVQSSTNAFRVIYQDGENGQWIPINAYWKNWPVDKEFLELGDDTDSVSVGARSKESVFAKNASGAFFGYGTTNVHIGRSATDLQIGQFAQSITIGNGLQSTNFSIQGNPKFDDGLTLGGEWRTNWPSGGGGGITYSTIETNFDETSSPLVVSGLVAAVYSDSEIKEKSTLILDNYFPTNRLAFENWQGSVTSITVDSANGYAGTFDATPNSRVTTNCNFRVTGEDGVSHFITSIDGANIQFTPALTPGETYAVEFIRGIAVDQYGLHAGSATGNIANFLQIQTSPSGIGPALATHDGVTVFCSYNSGRVWKSTDGGDSWTKLTSSPSGNDPAIATHDGVTVFYSYDSGRVWKSTDGGDSWTQLTSSPSGNYPALATHDGVTVFCSYNSGRVWKSYPIFAATVTATATAIITAVPQDTQSIYDIAAAITGGVNTYWTLETATDEWGIWDAAEYPMRWQTIAKKEEGVWYIRGTNGMEATSATDAASAVSAAIAANPLNRAAVMVYSPVYGFGGFTGGIPMRWATTFVPATATNAPGVAGVSFYYSRYGNIMHLDNPNFQIQLAATNPVSSSVAWKGDGTARTIVYYTKEEEE